MLTPTQSRMARAALRVSLREVASHIGCSHTSLAYFERGDLERLSAGRIAKLEDYYRAQGIVFGPASGVAIQRDVFAGERGLIVALWRVLQAHRIYPTSTELMCAMRNE